MKKFLVFFLLCGAAIVARATKNDGSLHVTQSSQIESLVKTHISYNKSHSALKGYRIRIYRDNVANARHQSQETLDNFKSIYPHITAYRTYDNPYFRVAIGDFRTKDDALSCLSRIKNNFPNSFIITENIGTPTLQSAIPADSVENR